MNAQERNVLPHFRSRRAALIAVLGAVFLLTVPAQAQRGDSEQIKGYLRTNPKFMDTFRTVVASASRSTVQVFSDDDVVALGTIVGADGWILTRAGDLKGDIVCRLRDGREFDARIVGVHEAHDLAVLKINAHGLTPVQWRSSNEDAVGSWVASAGLKEQPLAVGVISVAARKVSGGRGTAPVTGYLGVFLGAAKEGVKITDIAPESAAAKAGIKKNDLVLSISGKAVSTVEQMQEILGGYQPGVVVAVRLRRGEEQLDVQAKLGKRPPMAGRADKQNRMGSELSERRVGFPEILQHDSVIRPRDCGGPLVDLDGKVIGINVSRAGRTESYAIPAEVIRPLLPELMSGRLAPRSPGKTEITSK